MNAIMKSALVLATVVPALSASAFTTTVNFPPAANLNGKMAVLGNIDTEQPTDSVVITDNKAVFNADRIRPYLAYLTVDGKQMANAFIFDQADVNVTLGEDGQDVTGGLNKRQKDFFSDLALTIENYNSSQATNTMGETLDVVVRHQLLQEIKANIDNPLGYMYIISLGDTWLAPGDLDALIRDFPDLAKYHKIKEIMDLKAALAETQPGKRYVDFRVEYNNEEHWLSDVVGKGDYVLVDFWASWCAPCRREMPKIRRIQAKYESKGLKVLGVAVWDEPENSIAAAEQMGLTWPIWVNGTEKTTNTYGIKSIPALVLFGPDGKIVARSNSSADISAALAKALK